MSDAEISQGWHYSQGGEQIGPVSATRLVSLHLSKQVKPDDQVWHPSLPAWCTLREAWPKLRPFKEQVVGSSAARRAGARRTYKVVDAPEPLTAEALQDLVGAHLMEGWGLHQVVSGGAVAEGQSLVVFVR